MFVRPVENGSDLQMNHEAEEQFRGTFIKYINHMRIHQSIHGNDMEGSCVHVYVHYIAGVSL